MLTTGVVLSESQCDQPTGDHELDLLLKEARLLLGTDLQVISVKEDKKSIWCRSHKKTTVMWKLYRYEGGTHPYVEIPDISTRNEAKFYILGLTTGYRKGVNAKTSRTDIQQFIN
jgi:hypothetical protein